MSIKNWSLNHEIRIFFILKNLVGYFSKRYLCVCVCAEFKVYILRIEPNENVTIPPTWGIEAEYFVTSPWECGPFSYFSKSGLPEMGLAINAES